MLSFFDVFTSMEGQSVGILEILNENAKNSHTNFLISKVLLLFFTTFQTHRFKFSLN